jgi:hypothetical protein
MKLKTFNRKDCNMGANEKRPLIGFEKTGIIRLNRKLCEALNIEIGDKINILQDQESPRDWYIELTKAEHGLVMRKHNTGALCCNAKAIVAEIQRSLGVVINKSMNYRVSTQPAVDETNIYAIITRD